VPSAPTLGKRFAHQVVENGQMRLFRVLSRLQRQTSQGLHHPQVRPCVVSCRCVVSCITFPPSSIFYAMAVTSACCSACSLVPTRWSGGVHGGAESETLKARLGITAAAGAAAGPAEPNRCNPTQSVDPPCAERSLSRYPSHHSRLSESSRAVTARQSLPPCDGGLKI
jgi:hypothetical protein